MSTLVDAFTDRLPWRVQSLLGYRPRAAVLARELFPAESEPTLDRPFFKQVLPGGEIPLEQPVFLNGTTHPNFTENERRYFDPCNFFTLEGATYIQHNLLPTVITADNRLVTDANRDPKKGRLLHPIFSVQKLPEPQVLNGRTIVLSVDGAHNGYFHWSCQLIPKLCVLDAYDLSLNDFDHIIVNGPEMGFKTASFREFDFPIDKVIFSTDGQAFKCEQLTVVNNIGYHMEGIQKLRKVLLNNGANGTDESGRLYISRKNARFRKILNEQELIDLLESHGFRIVHLEEHPLRRQAELINQASVVISAHGAGLSNIVFSDPSQQLIEILPSTYVNTIYWFYANLMGLRYAALICEGVVDPSVKRMNMSNIRLGREDLSSIDNLLKNMVK